MSTHFLFDNQTDFPKSAEATLAILSNFHFQRNVNWFRVIDKFYKMKKYKLETAIFYSKISKDRDHLIKSSELELQGILDRRAEEGWKLVSTDATNFGSAVYFYLYFEQDAL